MNKINESHNNHQFRPRKYTWLITMIAGLSYILSGIFILFAFLIISDAELINKYLNWVVASIISAILLVYITRLILKYIGAEVFYETEHRITKKIFLSGTKYIDKVDLVHIKLIEPNPATEYLPFSSPVIVFYTHDKIIRLKLYKYQNKNEIYQHYKNMSNYVSDEFAEFYHRSKHNMGKLILRFSQDTPGIIGLSIIIIYVFLALWGAFALLISPPNLMYSHTLFLRNPEFQNYDLDKYTIEEVIWHPPSKDFWFGTDFIGRDLFSRLVYGTTFTFMIAISGSLISMIFILFFGLSSAFFPGVWDNIVTRMSDSLLSFPPFIFLILISAISLPLRVAIPGGYFLAVYTGMAFVTWPLGARMIRTEVIELLNMEYIIASSHLGASRLYILFKHIIPRITHTVLILFSYQFSDIILGTTLLGFIGFGSESTLTWGSDLSHGLYGSNPLSHWWVLFFPSLWIFLLVLGLTLFADSVRDSLDPKLRGGIQMVPYEQRKELGM